jgi:acetyltransferase-like isoleucine patch superfamily enzyme
MIGVWNLGLLFCFKVYFRCKRIILCNSLSNCMRKAFHYSYLRYFGVETQIGYVRLIGLPIIKRAAETRIILGKGVTLVSKSEGNAAGINHPVILATLAEGAVIQIEDGCGLSGSSICAVRGVRIGRNSGLGANACVYDTDFHVAEFSLDKESSIVDAKSAPVAVGENVWIGANSMVLKGVRIGDNAVIGAGAVVRNDVGGSSVVIGNPAKEVKRVSEEK